MESTIKLLDKYKKVRSITSDLACAESLGVGRAAVSKWRNGGGHPEADSVEKMCDAIHEPLRQWLPLIEAERARSPAVRRVWLRLAQAAAAVTLTFGLLNVQTTHAEGIKSFSHNPGTLYIMSTFIKRVIALGTSFAYRFLPKEGTRNNEIQMAV